MTHPTLDHEERLRSALRAAADSVEPAADGLGRIRARLTPPRPAIAAWMVTGTEPAMLRLRLAATWLRLRLGLAYRRIGPAAGRARPALGQIAAPFTGIMPAPGEPRTRAAWLRPAGALAAFVVIIGSGALAISQLQQQALPTGSPVAIGGSSGGHPNSGSGGGLNGTAHQLKNTWLKNTTWPLAPLTPQLNTGPLAPDPRQASPAPSSTCPPSPKPSATPSPTSPSPSVSPSPTPSPTSPSPSVSPSPSPSGSVSPSPGASTMPTSSAAPSGASVNTVAYLGSPATGSTVSPSPGSDKTACAPAG